MTPSDKDEEMNRAMAAQTGSVYCAKCGGKGSDRGTCSECSDGSRLLNGLCVPCREDMHHCRKCDAKNKDKCDKCYTNVADMDADGKCTKCKGLWYRNQEADGSVKCKCDEHINVRAGFTCETCGKLIPGCLRCE